MAKNGKNDTGGKDMCFRIMMEAVMLGVTPEEYAEFYAMVNGMLDNGKRNGILVDPVIEAPVAGSRLTRARKGIAGLKDAADKTLTLKVQMQDVAKPPMWRELKVPADFTFLQLHKAIQAACGFEDAHLWQFQYKAYDPELQIGLPSDHKDPFGMGLEEWTHDAGKTGITAFLAEKGQKLVYVYDFGDDWIFNVSVVNVAPRDGEVAECTRWKSDLQPIEDSGGVWSYLNMRTAWEDRNTLTNRQKKELLNWLGFDSFDELEDVIGGSLFDPETVNEALAEI